MFKITEPCSWRWADFPGADERRRFCGDCGKFVHDVASYTEAELKALGPVCGYVGGETFASARSRRAVMAGVVLTTISPLLAQDGRVRVVVTDATGAGVQFADVTVGDRRVKADENGVASLVGLPVGRVEIMASSPGFKSWRGSFNVLNGTEVKVDARLEVGSLGGGIEVVGTGRLIVSVRDATKAALVNAEVLVKGSDGTSRTGRVDGQGLVSLANLPAGKLQVEVRAPGFKVWQSSAMLALGGDERIEARMEVSDPGTKIAVKPSVGRRFVDWLTSCTRR